MDWVHWFNTERGHESIDDFTPAQVERLHYQYRAGLAVAKYTKPTLRTLRGVSRTEGDCHGVGNC